MTSPLTTAGRDGPDDAVLEAFGLCATPTALAGGEGVAFLVDGAVVKHAPDPHEAAWIQELAHRMVPDGFRTPAPRPTRDGSWVHDHWTASEHVDAMQPMAPDWDRIVAVGQRFADAADPRRTGLDAAPLATRTHRWAVADRVAWDETTVTLDPPAAALLERLRSLCPEAADTEVAPGDRTVVHADLAGNVFVDPEGVPVVLDLSPYVRPAAWGGAIVVADAVLWNDAAPELAVELATTDQGADLLARALAFRLVAEQLADDPRHGARLEPYGRVLDALEP